MEIKHVRNYVAVCLQFLICQVPVSPPRLLRDQTFSQQACCL